MVTDYKTEMHLVASTATIVVRLCDANRNEYKRKANHMEANTSNCSQRNKYRLITINEVEKNLENIWEKKKETGKQERR